MCYISSAAFIEMWHAVAQLAKVIALRAGRSRFRFPIVSLEFFRQRYGPGGDSASNRKEYQEYFFFLGGGGGGAQDRQPYLLYVPIVLKSGSLNHLQPSGSVQACAGIALPFLLS